MRRKKSNADQAPLPPREPLPEECCGKGCTPCVLDIYAEKLDRYRIALQAWRQRNEKPLKE